MDRKTKPPDLYSQRAQQSAQVEPVSRTSFQQNQSAKKKPMKSNNENEGDVSTILQESDEIAQQSAQVEPVSGTSGVGYKRLPPTTSQQNQSAKKKRKKSNNENEEDVSTILQESDGSAQQSAQIEPVSGTSGVRPTASQQEGDVYTIPQESDESAQQSNQGKPVSGTSGVGYKRLPPTSSQQDHSAKKKPKKSNNENEGDVFTIPQESDESDVCYG